MNLNTDKPILLVEDSEDDVFLMRRAMKAAGVRNPLFVVGDGQDAVGYLKGDGPFSDRSAYPLPVLVLLDWKLPRRSGPEVLAWIRAHSTFDPILVVVLTSSAEEKDVLSAYARKANSYLVKPPTADELVALVKSFRSYWIDHNRFALIQRPPMAAA